MLLKIQADHVSCDTTFSKFKSGIGAVVEQVELVQYLKFPLHALQLEKEQFRS